MSLSGFLELASLLRATMRFTPRQRDASLQSSQALRTLPQSGRGAAATTRFYVRQRSRAGCLQETPTTAKTGAVRRGR